MLLGSALRTACTQVMRGKGRAVLAWSGELVAAAVVLRRRAAAATARLPAIAFVAYRVQAWASVRKPLSRGMAMGRPAHWRSRSAQQGLVSRPSAKYFRSAACFGCLSPGPAGVG